MFFAETFILWGQYNVLIVTLLLLYDKIFEKIS